MRLRLSHSRLIDFMSSILHLLYISVNSPRRQLAHTRQFVQAHGPVNSILLDAIRPRMTWQFAHIPMSWQFAYPYINSLISLVPRSSFYITFKSPSCVRGFLLEASLKSKNNSAHARKTFLSTELCLLPSIIAIQHKHKVR